MSDELIPQEEEALLGKVLANLATAPRPAREPAAAMQQDYARQLVEIRDEIAEARLEDVPALIAQMERIAGVANRRAEPLEVPVDPQAPYFAHLRLVEQGKARDVLIGRGTHIDSKSGVRIVDWRHAPISQLYYRYPEGASYEERFGGREVEGEVTVRRTVTISERRLLRVHAPQGVFVKKADDTWKQASARATELSGGQGSAARPETTKGVLGVGLEVDQRGDRHLPEIAALLDPRQFELISAPDSGVVVIQGGAGSGKTTIGLHRIAFLSYRSPERFRADRMLVVTYGKALSAYISEVLPALGVAGVKVVTFQDWATKRRKLAFPFLKAKFDEGTPSAVTRLKKHPALLSLLRERADRHLASPRAKKNARAALGVWAEALTDLPALRAAIAAHGDLLTEAELTSAHRWCSERCLALVEQQDREREGDVDADPSDAVNAKWEEREDDEPDDDSTDDRSIGVDGVHVEDDAWRLDREDDALLLRAYQLVAGALKKGKLPLVYDHLFVDEAQDLSPVELSVLLSTTTSARSVTLAGDTAQKLYLDNGFRDWKQTLADLGMKHLEIEPLRIAYRSTREVVEVAREVLGPLADPNPPDAPRTGAPVEAHVFPQQGAAVAFLADVLRPLFQREPRASVAILARFPEQADAYFDGLSRSEVPGLRRVRDQDFIFKSGIDVTDVRQVKGLEFDYVVLVDVNAQSYPADDTSRHLLHIAATRAAHQLWIVVTGAPSPLLPARLIDG